MKKFLIIAATLAGLLLAPALALADFATGKEAYDRRDWARAIMLLRPMAEQGDDRALLLLGNMYAQGYGVTRNAGEAYMLYRRAALAGNAEAMVVTGAMLQQGLGVTANVNDAFAWYGRAAESGNGGGALFYGLYLLRGNNSPDGNNILPDHPASYKWLRLSAKNSKDVKMADTAGKVADELAKTLDAEVLTKMDAEVAAWQPKTLAELGPAPGQTVNPTVP